MLPSPAVSKASTWISPEGGSRFLSRAPAMPPYLTTLADGAVLLHVYVQPKASKSRIVGLYDDCLKLAVAAPPVDGKANEEVIRFLSRLLNIPGRDIALSSGAQSRRKKVRIEACFGEVNDMIEKIMTSLAS